MKYPRRLRLAHLPTPIHQLERTSAQVGREIYVWRDDLTGFMESGNKARKLEFLLADALQQGATRIITAGGSQSNHTRTTAYLTRRLGLEVSIVVREPKQGRAAVDMPTGNLLLNQLCGADLTYISYAAYQTAGNIYRPFLEREAELAQQRGERPYVILEGGSVPLGCWGYIAGVEEMLNSWQAAGTGTSSPDALFCAVGSGGTLAGLQLGYQIYDLPLHRLWGVNVCDSEDYFQKRIGKLLADTNQEFGLGLRDPTLQILDGHLGEGYGSATDEDFDFYMKLAREDGVLLDPVYTGKAFRGMLREIEKAPSRFGEKILFLHSGGTFALFAYQEQVARCLKDTV